MIIGQRHQELYKIDSLLTFILGKMIVSLNTPMITVLLNQVFKQGIIDLQLDLLNGLHVILCLSNKSFLFGTTTRQTRCSANQHLVF